MQADNFDRILTAFRQRVPFRPFTITLVNGNRFEVDHPAAVVVRDGAAVFVGPGGVSAIFDHEGVSHFSGEPLKQSSPEPDRANDSFDLPRIVAAPR